MATPAVCPALDGLAPRHCSPKRQVAAKCVIGGGTSGATASSMALSGLQKNKDQRQLDFHWVAISGGWPG